MLTNPTARVETDHNGMFVHRNNLDIRQCIDAARESKFIKDAKIAAVIKNYSIQVLTYENWVLSRARMVEYQFELMNIAKMNRDAQKSWCFRPSELSKSEIASRKIIQSCRTQILLVMNLNKENLNNSKSGWPIGDSAADS